MFILLFVCLCSCVSVRLFSIFVNYFSHINSLSCCIEIKYIDNLGTKRQSISTSDLPYCHVAIHELYFIYRQYHLNYTKLSKDVLRGKGIFICHSKIGFLPIWFLNTPHNFNIPLYVYLSHIRAIKKYKFECVFNQFLRIATITKRKMVKWLYCINLKTWYA